MEIQQLGLVLARMARATHSKANSPKHPEINALLWRLGDILTEGAEECASIVETRSAAHNEQVEP